MESNFPEISERLYGGWKTRNRKRERKNKFVDRDLQLEENGAFHLLYLRF